MLKNEEPLSVRLKGEVVPIPPAPTRVRRLVLLALVLLSVGTGRLVGRAKEFDDGDNAIAARAVDDFEKGFGDGLGLGLDEERLRHGSTRFRPRFQASLRGIFDHAHVDRKSTRLNSSHRL